jgi:predicted transcriptional regulator
MLIPSDAMPARFSVTLPDQINKDLQEWADKEGRPKANLTAFLIESAVRARFPDRYPDMQNRGDRED